MVGRRSTPSTMWLAMRLRPGQRPGKAKRLAGGGGAAKQIPGHRGGGDAVRELVGSGRCFHDDGPTGNTALAMTCMRRAASWMFAAQMARSTFAPGRTAFTYPLSLNVHHGEHDKLMVGRPHDGTHEKKLVSSGTAWGYVGRVPRREGLCARKMQESALFDAISRPSLEGRRRTHR